MQNPNGEHNYYDSWMRQQAEKHRFVGPEWGRTFLAFAEGSDSTVEEGHPQNCNFVEGAGSYSEGGTQIVIITGSRLRGQPPAAENDWYSYQLSQTRGGWTHMPVEHDITNWQPSPKHQPIDFYAKAFDFAASSGIGWMMAKFALTSAALLPIGAAGVGGAMLSIGYDFFKSADGSLQNIGDIAMP